MCSRARTLATPQPQADWQASPGPAPPARTREYREEESPQKVDSGRPAGAAPLPSHVAWWVGTDLKLEKIRAIPTSECAARSSRSRAQFERGAPGGARRWELVKPSSGADGGTPGMAQLSVIPGSATAWAGELEPDGGGGRRGRGRSETACPHPHPTHTSSRSRGCWAPTTGGTGWVKRR